VLGKFSVGGEVGGESVDHGGQAGNVHGMLNLPLGDKTALRVSGFYSGAPGYIDDPKSGASDLNDGHKYGGRASLLYVPTSDLSIRLSADTQLAKYNGTNEVDVDPVSLQPLHGELTQERVVGQPSEFRYGNYSATIDWNLGAFRLMSITTFGDQNSSTVGDLTPVYGGAGDFVFNTSGSGAPLYGDVQLNKFTQEVRLASNATEKLEWQVGGYYTHESGHLVQNLVSVALPGGASLGMLIQPIVNSTYGESAGFADVTYHFSPQFDLQVGGRWSRNTQDATQITSINSVLAGAFGLAAYDSVSASSSGSVWTYSVARRA
jgi:hypothetical protein